MTKWLRYNDLVAMGIVNSRATLMRLIKSQGFPPGVMITPNARAWEDTKVNAWAAFRPTERKGKPPRRKRTESTSAQTAA
jgi:predicted DNA-binding transcriptional regulator AlpA